MVSINTLLQRHPKSKIANIHPIAQFVHSPKDVSPWLGNIRTLVYLPTTALNTHTHPPFEMNLRYNMGTRQKSFGPLQRSPLKLSINHKIQFKSKFSSNSFRSSYATVYHKTTAVLQLVPYCYRDPWDLIPLLSITGSYPKYVITDGVSDLQLRLHKQLIKIGNSTHNRCLYCPLLLIGNWDRDCCLRTVLHGDYIKLCKSLPCRTHRS
ncbi:uncharacterized protein LOC131997614 isoform X1 [Stomoxys calcitrans]|uniref:uncharacterized protein LOC131995146 isoform X1 n=2 Tax=Stomoxys calcitrans TaxID=35570 RepID=UPI0027E315BD|nr:uncharacterized protein LOC131995146 isoform X1 [Stomoxys calcitrans]XP_059219467.1 uncharacterized protein LOC131995211 isoform X1 [Stomoxys calcitrans]XP_059224626.1 uncharacterized protein LOC131997614 isoform X1 [Stomoxys calcitrans]XP_059224627.1 uncharacterized protein LOC131997614 isoform X1 [Stomoxys calcitrans]